MSSGSHQIRKNEVRKMDINEGIIRASVSGVRIMLRYEEQGQFQRAKKLLDRIIDEQGLPLTVNMPEFDDGIYSFIEVVVDEERIINDVGMMLHTEHGLKLTD